MNNLYNLKSLPQNCLYFVPCFSWFLIDNKLDNMNSSGELNKFLPRYATTSLSIIKTHTFLVLDNLTSFVRHLVICLHLFAKYQSRLEILFSYFFDKLWKNENGNRFFIWSRIKDDDFPFLCKKIGY